MNSEGDTLLSDDAVEGLGKKFLTFCFGTIISITSPVNLPSSRSISTNQTITPKIPISKNANGTMESSVHASVLHDTENSPLQAYGPETPPISSYEVTKNASKLKPIQSGPTCLIPIPTTASPSAQSSTSNRSSSGSVIIPEKDNLLTRSPTIGFFVAGAVAGAVSRTCTAPLDRLKTYLIANTAKSQLAISAAAKGDIIAVVMHLGRPLTAAFRELWKSGGIRSLYSGTFYF